MPGAEQPVVIVGGGIAGLAIGRALQTEALPFRIMERRRTAADAGLAIILPGNAIRALSMLGLKDQIEAIGHPVRRRQYRTSGDKLSYEIDEDGFWGGALCPRTVKRSALLQMLARGLPAGSIRHDAEVRSMTLHPTHAALALADGTDLAARLVIGADGIHSTIGKQVFGGAEVRSKPLLADATWRFMVPNPGVDCWTCWIGKKGIVMLCPVGPDEVYGWAIVTRPEPGISAALALQRLSRSFPDRVRWAIMHAVSRRDGLYHSPLEEVRRERWHHGRATLIGDAAHATAPVWAQGAALALEDAIVLARSLATCPDIPAALADFQSRRWHRVAHVKAATDVMSKSANLPPFIRDLLLPFVGPRRYRQAYGPLKSPIWTG